MTVVLRLATAADASACATILGAFFTDTPWLPRLHTFEEDTGFLTGLIGRTDVTVAQRDGVVCGYCAVDGAEVDHLYLAMDARGQGIGSQLMDAAKTGRNQLKLWCFQQNTRARTFYAKHGFTEIARTDGATNEECLPDVQLQWRAR